MLRPALLGLIAALAVQVSPGYADTPHTPEISCRVLLAAQPIPDDAGHRISIEEITIPAGHDGHLHTHDWPEYMHVLSGNGTLSITGQPDIVLSPDAVAVIPMKIAHQPHNDSDSRPLIYTATFVENTAHHTVTHYVGEPDKPHGCPHVQK